jgi:hypothetical protein
MYSTYIWSLKEKHMNLKAALIAATLALSSAANAAVVDPNEPATTPAGGSSEAGISVAQGVGAAVTIAVIIGLAGGGGDDSTTTTTTTTTTTGP